MGKNISDFLSSLPAAWKALTALGGAVAVGVALTLSAVGFIGLPADVEANTLELTAHTRAIDSLRATTTNANSKLDRVVCLLEVMAEDGNPLRCER